MEDTEAEVVDSAFSYGIHSGAASSWDDQACAKLCDMVMLANNGLGQQVANNQTELMDVLSTKALEGPIDDLGLTLPFLAVYYDQPEILEYLRKRGIDLKAVCDPMEYGNPMFYAIYLRRIRMIRTLDILGVSVREPCDSLKTVPLQLATRTNDQYVKDEIAYCWGKEQRAGTLVTKHYKRIVERRKYLFKLKIIPLMLRVMRGMIARARVRRMRKEIDKIARKAARHVRREEKLAKFELLDSDDESTLEDMDEYML